MAGGMPAPYFQRDGVTIYHARAEDMLPLLPGADVVLTDPPYGIDGGSGSINLARGKGAYRAGFADTEDHLRSVVVPIIRRLIETTPCVVLTPGNRRFALYPQPDSFGVFYQPAGAGLQVFGNLDAQPIFYYGKNGSGRNMGVPCSYVLVETPEPSIHPCPKPLKAWRRLLASVSKPGQLVLDPFMGSGTTLRAALDLRRRAIGIEIEERYCEVAARRLDQMVLPLESAS